MHFFLKSQISCLAFMGKQSHLHYSKFFPDAYFISIQSYDIFSVYHHWMEKQQFKSKFKFPIEIKTEPNWMWCI